MFEYYCHERQVQDRQTEMVRQVEFLRQFRQADDEVHLLPATGLRAGIAGLLRGIADHLDDRGSGALLRTS